MTGTNLKVQIYDVNSATTLLTCATCKVSAASTKTATITANNATTATSANSLTVKFDGATLGLTASSDISCELVSTASPYTSCNGVISTSSATSLEVSFTDLPAGEYKAYV